MKRHRIELQPPRHGSEHKESSGLVEAQRAREARRGKPDAADAPPLRTFKGKPPQIDGQLPLEQRRLRAALEVASSSSRE